MIGNAGWRPQGPGAHGRRRGAYRSPSSLGGWVVIGRIRQWARRIKQDIRALYFAARDPRIPWYAKAIAAAVAGYALSPLDLIPDFIPVFGLLDDLVIVPLGILFAVRLIPAEIMAEHRAAAVAGAGQPRAILATMAIVMTWLVLAGISGGLAVRWLLQS